MKDANHTAGARSFLSQLWGPLGLIIAAGALHYSLLLTFPAPFADEVWSLCRDEEFVETWKPACTLDRGVFDRIDHYWVIYPLIPMVVQSAPLLAGAAPSLPVVRMVTLGVGLALLAVIFVLAQRLADRRTALLTTALLSVSLSFFYSAHVARADIIAAFFGYVSLAVLAGGSAMSWQRGAAAGLLFALGLECHPHLAVLGPALAVIVLFCHGTVRRKLSALSGLACGGAAGVGIYALFHVVPHPDAYFTVNAAAFSSTHSPPLLSMTWARILLSAGDFAKLVRNIYPAGFPFFFCAPCILLWRADRTGSILAAALLSVAAANILLISHHAGYYFIYSAPLFAFAAAAALFKLLRHTGSKLVQRLGSTFAGALLLADALFVLHAVHTISDGCYEEYVKLEAQIGPLAARGDSAMGHQIHWEGLRGRKYYSWESVVYYRRFFPESSVEQAFSALKPDLLILDGHTDTFINESIPENPYLAGLSVPLAEVALVLEKRGREVSRIKTACFGTVRIYRLQWD